MNFKEYLESLGYDPKKLMQSFIDEDLQQEEFYKKIANKIAQSKNLPLATNLLAEGGFALVFNTTNPNMVVRVTDNEELNNACDYVISRPEIQATGGVNKIFGMFTHKEFQKEQELLVMYKEKVETNWQPLFNNVFVDTSILNRVLELNHSKTTYDDEHLKTFNLAYNRRMPFVDLFSKRILMGLYFIIPNKSIINFLDSLEIPRIENLISAIKKGLPILDLHSKNLGLDKDKNLIVIDC